MNDATEGKRSTPFAPGFGTIPDYVAGRKEEFRRLGDNLHDIAENRQKDGCLPYTPPSPIVLVGPRGVGKTLLLGWVAEQAKGKDVHVARISAIDDSPEDGMMDQLVRAIVGAGDEKFWQRIKGLNLSLDGFGGGIELHQKALTGFKQVLEIKLQEKPMVLLMDEVQHYHARSLGLLLGVAQELINSKYPLMVLLAGTPDMKSLLMKTKASFAVRGERMSINLLADEDVRDGLEQPFVSRGVKVEENALQKMQSLTDSYPYFIQTVGHAIWTALQDEKEEEKRKIVDLPLVEKARRKMEEQRDEFYSILYHEMHVEKILACAQQVTKIFKISGNQPMSRGVFEAGLEKMDKKLLPDNKEATEIVSILEDRGFLWPDPNGLLGPGIPSFLNFLEQRDAKEAKDKDYVLPKL